MILIVSPIFYYYRKKRKKRQTCLVSVIEMEQLRQYFFSLRNYTRGIITANYCFNKILKSLKPSYKILFARGFQWQRGSERNKWAGWMSN